MDKISPRAHAAILRRVAQIATADALTAQKKARESPTEKRVRAAFRACVLAARTLRRAAPVSPGEAGEMLAEAVRIEAVAERLKVQLARIIEG